MTIPTAPTLPRPAHSDAEPYTLTAADLLELRAHAAVERVVTPRELPGDRELAQHGPDWATVHRLRTLELLSPHGGSSELVTDSGHAVIAAADEGRAETHV